jgi:hypothetical protein
MTAETHGKSYGMELLLVIIIQFIFETALAPERWLLEVHAYPSAPAYGLVENGCPIDRGQRSSPCARGYQFRGVGEGIVFIVKDRIVYVRDCRLIHLV